MAMIPARASTLTPASDWSESAVARLLPNNDPGAVLRFRKQPLANKVIALEDAVVQPRRDNTADQVATLVSHLVNVGAITAAEAAPVYSDLLIRVHRYNSTNVQHNLTNLVTDIASAQSQAIRRADLGALTNQSVLSAFFAEMPQTVPSGQANFVAFKEGLRLLVNEGTNVTVYRSGPDTLLQVNLRPRTTTNLTSAFRSLAPLWGVMLEGEEFPPGLSNRLSTDARVLMLLVAPFTNESTFVPDSLISHLMRLYRETVSEVTQLPWNTETEIDTLIDDLGAESINTAKTMAYLLKNREAALENPRQLSPRQTQILRFVQESLTDRIDRNGEEPAEALDQLPLSFSPAFYASNGGFIRRLVAYLQFALQASPSYFREIYANKYWVPPASFWTQNFSDFFEETRQAAAERRNSTAADPGQFSVDELPIGAQEPQLEWDDDYDTAQSASYRPRSVRSEPAMSTTVASSDVTPARGFRLARALASPVAGAIGYSAGEALYPGAGRVTGPVASAAAAALFPPKGSSSRDDRNRRRRAAEQAARRRERLGTKYGEDTSSDTSLETRVGDRRKALRDEIYDVRRRDLGGSGGVDPFAHLRSGSVCHQPTYYGTVR
ncbi:pIIIa [Bearded dragon adenovirus 1]|uniref:PIIIa n=1 Tax=Bearded dragon adenovirus 1 TaxID=2729647 RepID=A0A6N3IR66_9ADEN|nr:pIIIa [Bearded dragon adenovirus 1]QJR83091.1 pIIIa [Bearded dragon adenovirus 1]